MVCLLGSKHIFNYFQGLCIVLTSADKPTSAVKRLRSVIVYCFCGILNRLCRRNWSPSANERDKATPCKGSYELNEKSKEVTIISSVKQPKYPQMRDATGKLTLESAFTFLS